jgi:hypothetical protein
MARPSQDPGTRTLLHHPPGVEHDDTVADPQHHGQLVADEHHGHAPVDLEALEQLEHLGLLGCVEHGHRLVGDEQLGLQDQRSGQGHPL